MTLLEFLKHMVANRRKLKIDTIRMAIEDVDNLLAVVEKCKEIPWQLHNAGTEACECEICKAIAPFLEEIPDGS